MLSNTRRVPEASTLPNLEPRKLTDPRAMRAVAHPVRIALLEVLGTEGPLTATQAGELIGESPTTCSFHLRQLAKYGFIEEVAGVAGRKRPWRLVHTGLTLLGRQRGPGDPPGGDRADSRAARRSISTV